MKQFIIALLLVASFFISELSAQVPTYSLKATCQIQSANVLTFDIVMKWTNSGTAPVFEYAGGQYFLDFNLLLGNGGTMTMSNAGSDLPSNMQPRNPTVYTVTTPAQLRWAVNTFPGAGSGFNFPPDVDLLIVRAQLSTTAPEFAEQPFNLTWRSSLPNPYTKIFAYVGTTNTEISNPSTHSVDLQNCPGGLPISLLEPANNSYVNKGQVTFRWSRVEAAQRYKFTLSRSSNLGNPVYVDSTVIDTFTTINVTLNDTALYWGVIAKDSSGLVIAGAGVYKFTNSILLDLKCAMQAMLIPVPGLLPRKQPLKVYLRSISPPYEILDSSSGFIDSATLTGRFWFITVPQGTYYIVAKHYNCVETWSKPGGETTRDSIVALTYDFTSARTQAYGNNMRLKGGKYCFYSGEVDQDGFIDATDLARIDNEAYNFTVGDYLPEDLDGNGVVDAADFSVADNNRHFIGIVSPLNPSASFRQEYDVDEMNKVFIQDGY